MPSNSPRPPSSGSSPPKRGGGAERDASAPSGASSRLAKTDPSSLKRQEATSNPPAAVESAARHATYALLAFTTLTVIALVAWFARADEPWGFSSLVALLSAFLGGGTAALLWRRPTREHAIAGLAVVAVSLLRVGGPTGWNGSSFVMIAITAALAVPLVQAVRALPRG